MVYVIQVLLTACEQFRPDPAPKSKYVQKMFGGSWIATCLFSCHNETILGCGGRRGCGVEVFVGNRTKPLPGNQSSKISLSQLRVYVYVYVCVYVCIRRRITIHLLTAPVFFFLSLFFVCIRRTCPRSVSQPALLFRSFWKGPSNNRLKLLVHYLCSSTLPSLRRCCWMQ